MPDKSIANRAVFAAAVPCCIIWCTWGGADYASAQRTRARRSTPDQFLITSGMAEAARYMTSDPERSLQVLRRLDGQFPRNDRIKFRIGLTFQVMGRADSAIVYFDQTLTLNPTSIEAGKTLGTLYFTQEKRDEGMSAFERLLQANKHSMAAYKAVGTALKDLNRYEEALTIYTEGRDRSNQHFDLTIEIAELHRSARQYRDALDEYLRYVDGRPGNYRYTRDRITRMMRDVDETSRAGLIESLEARIETARGSRFVTLDVLAATYLEQGLLEKSLNMAITADAEKESDGTVLLTLADQVITTATVRSRDERYRYLDLGVRALDAFSKNHSRSPGSDRARYMLATIYVQFGSGQVPGAAVTAADQRGWIDKAITEYAELGRRYPGSEYAEKANLERGDLLLRRLKDPVKALEAFKVGAINSRRYGDVFAARVAEVYLGTGEYGDADHYLNSLKTSGVELLVETGSYYTGVLLVLQNQFEVARDTLAGLAESNPSSGYTNNAIELAWVIEEALMFESSFLPTWVNAMQAQMLGDTAAVLAGLKDIVAGPEYDPLRPRALFWTGQTLHAGGQLDAALQVYNQFLREYPSAPHGPDAQRAIASVYEFGYEQYDKALREYEVVLMMYPDYAFLDEVRKDVRRLRFIVEGEE